MISQKTNFVLLIMLVCQLLLIALLYFPNRNTGQSVVDLVPRISIDNVSGLTISDEDEKTLSLHKKDNGDWMIDNVGKAPFPADSEQVQRIVNTLTSIQSQRLVSRTRSSHIRLKVAEKVFAKKITFAGKDGKEAVLYLGTSPGSQTIHARAQGMDNVYLVSGIATWEMDTNKETWLQKGYVSLDRNRLHTVILQNEHGSFTLTNEGGKWHVTGDTSQQVPEPRALNAFLQQVTQITVNNYLDKKYEGPPLNEVVLTLITDKNTVTVNFGPEKDKKGKEYIIKSSASPFYALADSYQVNPFTDMKKENLYKKADDTIGE